MSDTPIYSEALGRVVNAYVEAACARAVAVATGGTSDDEAHAKAAREFDRVLHQLDEADDLLTLLDDSFSGRHEIRFVPTDEPIDNRTEKRDGATIVWVDCPPSVNEFSDTERPHETVRDALRDWGRP